MIELSAATFSRINKINQYLKKFTILDDEEELSEIDKIEEVMEIEDDISDNLVKLDPNTGKVLILDGVFYSILASSPFSIKILTLDKMINDIGLIECALFNSIDFFKFRKENSKANTYYDRQNGILKFVNENSEFITEPCNKQIIKKLIDADVSYLTNGDLKKWKSIAYLEHDESKNLFDDFKLIRILYIGFLKDGKYRLVQNGDDTSDCISLLSIPQKFIPKLEPSDEIGFKIFYDSSDNESKMNICLLKLKNKQRELHMKFKFIGMFHC